MNLESMIKKLRKAADTLEDLFVDETKETKVTANKILKRNKPHWTQTKEGKEKLAKNMRKMWKDKQL